MPVYAIRKVGTDLVKIGVSLNVEKRCRALQHMTASHLSVIYKVSSGEPYRVERQLHQEYEELGWGSDFGEWFNIAPDQEEQLTGRMEFYAQNSAPALPGGEQPDPHGWLREPLAEAFAAGGWTLEALAATTGYRKSFLDAVLHGDKPLTAGRVGVIARYLEIELTARIPSRPALGWSGSPDPMENDL